MATKTPEPTTVHGIKHSAIKVGATFKFQPPRGAAGRIKITSVDGDFGSASGVWITGIEMTSKTERKLRPGYLRKNA